MESLGGLQILPIVVDISMLYGPLSAAGIQQPYWGMVPSGTVEGISDADVNLAYVLGTRLSWSASLPSPITISLPGGQQNLSSTQTQSFDQLVNVSFLYLVADGSPLAVSFILTGNMCAHLH